MESSPYCWVYSRDDKLYTVGFWLGTDWQPMYDCNSQNQAIELISFLNGGEKPRWFGG